MAPTKNLKWKYLDLKMAEINLTQQIGWTATLSENYYLENFPGENLFKWNLAPSPACIVRHWPIGLLAPPCSEMPSAEHCQSNPGSLIRILPSSWTWHSWPPHNQQSSAGSTILPVQSSKYLGEKDLFSWLQIRYKRYLKFPCQDSLLLQKQKKKQRLSIYPPKKK